AMGRDYWKQFPSILDAISRASDEGIKVSFDVYPYTATASVLYTLLPEWVSDGGKIATLNRLRDRAIRNHVIDDMHRDDEDYDRIRIARGGYAAYTGKTIRQIARNQNVSPTEALMNMILATEDRAIAFVETISSDNVERAIVHPRSIISSAAAGYREESAREGQLTHPRSFGTFPRFLSEYVRSKNLLSWEEAVAKITGRPAQLLRLPHRGVLKSNHAADIIVMNPHTIADMATYDNPYRYPRGIEYVIVNGVIALQNGKHMNALPGRVLRQTESPSRNTAQSQQQSRE
ncbi:MAG: amidohydrolase family protein, partial [Parcubacteria group bacterium]|nr:amidohydrolase family protein [Parcubacteria group bacterium]